MCKGISRPVCMGMHGMLMRICVVFSCCDTQNHKAVLCAQLHSS